jgi:hypothetical protein
MAIVYRTDGAWGAGKGSDLAPGEVDGNFYDIDSRVTYFEDNPPLPIEPISITITGYNFYMGLSNGETLGPVVMTMPVPEWRGAWTPATPYNDMDFFTAPDGGFGAVMQAHTSAATFDWAAVGTNDLSNYRQIVGSSGMAVALSGLTDVALSGIATGDMLVWDGASSYWRNLDPIEAAENFAVFEGDTGAGGSQGVVPAPAPGDASAGKVLGAGGTWIVPAGGEGGGSSSLAGLSDVSIIGPANGSLLQYLASDGKWHNATLAALGAGTVTQVNTGTGLSGGPITGAGTIQIAPVAGGLLLANATGATAVPHGVTLSTYLDAAIGSARGSILRRDATQWSVLAPGSSGTYLKSGGASADVSWDSPVGAGTVTSVNSGAGLTGGPITASGTLSLAPVANGSVLANISGSSLAPSATTLTLLMDNAFGSGRGQLVYRGASGWSALSPGTNGFYLQTRGSGADPIWTSVKGGGGTTTPPSLWNIACALATTEPLPANSYSNGSAGVGATLSGTANGALSVDGTAVVVGDRILVKDEANLARNGAYTVTATGSAGAAYVLTRAADYDAPAEIVQGSAFPISGGATLDSTAWVLITGGTIVVGTTPLEYEAITATMPICGPGQVLGNPLGVPAPAVPMDPVDGGGGGETLPAGTTHDQLVYVGGMWTAQRPRYIVGAFVPGVLSASQMLLMHTVSKAVTFPANFGSYLGHASQARGSAAATGSTVIAVQQATAAAPGTFTGVGTITFAAAALVGTFASSGGAAVSFAAGDTLALVAPASADATFSGFAATLAGMET